MKTINDLPFTVSQEVGKFTKTVACITQALQEYLAENNLSLDEFAEKFTVDKDLVAKWLTNRYNFNLLDICFIEAYIGIKILK